MYSVTYLAYNCDDGLGERFGRLFDNLDLAIRYWADVSETEDGVTISVLPETNQEDELPF